MLARGGAARVLPTGTPEGMAAPAHGAQGLQAPTQSRLWWPEPWHKRKTLWSRSMGMVSMHLHPQQTNTVRAQGHARVQAWLVRTGGKQASRTDAGEAGAHLCVTVLPVVVHDQVFEAQVLFGCRSAHLGRLDRLLETLDSGQTWGCKIWHVGILQYCKTAYETPKS